MASNRATNPIKNCGYALYMRVSILNGNSILQYQYYLIYKQPKNIIRFLLSLVLINKIVLKT